MSSYYKLIERVTETEEGGVTAHYCSTIHVQGAWRMRVQDSNEIAALEDQPVSQPDSLKHWDGLQHWPGAYVKGLKVKADKSHRAGKGMLWLSNDKEMVDGQISSDFVHLIGMVDTANGVAARQGKEITWGFPNLDLQIHMYRYPTGKWLGLEAIQQYGADGIGLTSAVLHDTQGPFGRSEQILTLRKV